MWTKAQIKLQLHIEYACNTTLVIAHSRMMQNPYMLQT